MSPRPIALDRSIALALVEDGRACIGETLRMPMPEGGVVVTLTNPVFFDPQGARLDG